MNSTKTMICAALSALIALLTSCSCPQSVTLTLRDQPGEILLPLQVDKDGNFRPTDHELNADTNGWNPNGGSLSTYMYFKEHNVSSDLSCTNETDKFSVSNNVARLTYKVGLMSGPEMNILNYSNAIVSAYDYWLGSPLSYNFVNASSRLVGTTGSNVDVVSDSNGVRPSVSLTPGTEYASGDGSMTNPYVVRTN